VDLHRLCRFFLVIATCSTCGAKSRPTCSAGTAGPRATWRRPGPRSSVSSASATSSASPTSSGGQPPLPRPVSQRIAGVGPRFDLDFARDPRRTDPPGVHALRRRTRRPVCAYPTYRLRSRARAGQGARSPSEKSSRSQAGVAPLRRRLREDWRCSRVADRVNRRCGGDCVNGRRDRGLPRHVSSTWRHDHLEPPAHRDRAAGVFGHEDRVVCQWDKDSCTTRGL